MLEIIYLQIERNTR